MGVYIKGMEMPRSCKECGIRGVYCRTYIGFHHKDTARARKCPLVEIEDEPQTNYVLSKDSDAYKFNKRMEVEEMWLNEQSGKE